MTSPAPAHIPQLHWLEDGADRAARWRSEAGLPAPRRVRLADDTLAADAAYRLACEGTAVLWRGDFQNARQLLQALARRADRRPRGAGSGRRGQASVPDGAAPQKTAPAAAQLFHLHRQAQAQRARVLNAVLIQLDGDHVIDLRRAPDLRAACAEAWGPPDGQPSLVSLRELLGLIGAHEWRKKGVEIKALGPPPENRIHPHYGVFSPIRGEYLELVSAAALPSMDLAFDIGTGTGVLAALLARRGVHRVIATELDPRALACARDNLDRLGLSARVELLEADLFPPGQAPLVVCNPPWLPARPSSPLEHAIYDEGSRMLRGFLSGLAPRLAPQGEGWLILSDLAEHLGLRSRQELLAWIAQAGLKVLSRKDVRPHHPKSRDIQDPLAAARSREITSLWRLAVA